jgi:O-antigen/teichoic acid export membrane protein
MAKKKSFLGALLSNLSYAYISQGISMIISIVFTLVIPKVLGVEGYGYWQLIVFYASYLGVLYLGLNDGLYLREGGKSYSEINHSVVATQSRVFFVLHSVIAAILIVLVSIFIKDANRAFVMISAAIYIPFFNLKGLLTHTMQAVNHTKVFSLSVMIDKILILLAVIVALVCDIENFHYYVVVYVAGGIVATIYCCIAARKILLAPTCSVAELKSEIKENIKAGMPLMLSSFAAMLITGVSRQVIDIRWDISEFGKISLAITMMNFVLMFINQSSLVLFPSMRRMSTDGCVSFYKSANNILNIILPLVLVVYVPVGVLVCMWLPNYKESVAYLGIMLPICIFDGKMSLLGNTYYKMMRLERKLLVINIVTFVLNAIFSILGALVFNSITFIVVGLVISIAFRSLISEIYLHMHMKIKFDFTTIVMIVLSIGFAVFNNVFEQWISFLIYTGISAVMFVILLPQLKKSFGSLKSVMKNANKTIIKE